MLTLNKIYFTVDFLSNTFTAIEILNDPELTCNMALSGAANISTVFVSILKLAGGSTNLSINWLHTCQ